MGQVWPTDKAEGTNPRTVPDKGADATEDVGARGSEQWWRIPVAPVPDGSAEEAAMPGRGAGRPALDARAREGALPPDQRATDRPLPVAVEEAAGEYPTDTSRIDWLFEHLGRLDRPAHPVAGAGGDVRPPQGVVLGPAGGEAEPARFDEALRAPRWRYGTALSAFTLGLLTLFHLHHRKTRAAPQDAGRADPGRCPLHGNEG